MRAKRGPRCATTGRRESRRRRGPIGDRRGRAARSAPPRSARLAGQAGLVALEWLLIVAATAGLAALSVVLVQRVADDTAEQLGESSARRTAAAVAAAEVERHARAATPADPRTATWADWESHFAARCARLAILYSDAAAEIDAAFAAPTAADGADPISQTALASATEMDPTGPAAQIRCNIAEPDADTAAPSPPPPLSIEDFRAAAQAIAAEAATLRPGDTWATWKAHFEPLCGNLAAAYAHLGINVLSHFNHPRDQNPTDPVTQDLLDAATPASPADGRPQIKCDADR